MRSGLLLLLRICWPTNERPFETTAVPPSRSHRSHHPRWATRLLTLRARGILFFRTNNVRMRV